MAWLLDSRGQVLASLMLARSMSWSMRAAIDMAIDLGAGVVLWPGVGRATNGVALFLDKDLVVRRVRELRALRPWLMVSSLRVIVLPRHVVAVATPGIGDRLMIKS
ncbi:hypothetical protein [Ferrimicrobium sp.]|uniref:hypothetical protein n=1 Tax=Ferrimicrobium sp. TaxID=2926050 RepID=UPI002604206C|nr:hypothetical protein [Ferrimicrobium sp.]